MFQAVLVLAINKARELNRFHVRQEAAAEPKAGEPFDLSLTSATPSTARKTVVLALGQKHDLRYNAAGNGECSDGEGTG